MSTSTVTTAMLPLDLIDEPIFDSRLRREDGIESASEVQALPDLGASLLRGQIQPIRVEGPTEAGRYICVAGGRRIRAAKLAGMTELRAEIAPLSDDATRALDNITENLKRKDLSTFEVARSCIALRDFKLKGEEVGAKLGLSKSRVSNLVTAYTKNPPEIVEAWKNGDESLDSNFVSELARMTVKGKPASDEAKIAAWKERKTALDAAKETGMSPMKAKQAAKAKTGSGSSSAKLAFSESRFFAVKAWAVKTKQPNVVKALDYMIQQRKTPPDGIEADEKEKV